MKLSFQNKLNDAINRGINLGYDLCDIDLENNHTLETDIVKRNRKFKTIKLFDEFFLNGNANLNLYLQDKLSHDLVLVIDICCNQYNDNLYAKMKMQDNPAFLQNVIFKLCEDFGPKINLNWIDVSQLRALPNIFSGSIFDGDISQWNVSNCRDMKYMFFSSEFNGDISKWNVSHVKNMSMMFCNSKFNGDISKWDVSNVGDMTFMFVDSIFNQDLTHWNVEKAKRNHKMVNFVGDDFALSEKNFPDITWNDIDDENT